MRGRYWTRHWKQFVTLAAVVGALAQGAGAADPSDQIPACSELALRQWELVADHQLGLAAGEIVEAQRWIGPFANRKKAAQLQAGEFGGRNWFPADVFKRTVCGQLERFSIFDPAWSGDETDFHVHLQPSPAFQFAAGELEGATPHEKLYGEITLPKAMRSSPPWIVPGPRNLLGSGEASSRVWQAGDGVCLYGPWVTEEFHEFQGEIHPSELFWFRDGEALHVFAAHDASNRFQQVRFYCPMEGPPETCDTATPPEGFRAWASPSTRHLLMVAYELRLDAAETRRASVRVLKSVPPSGGSDEPEAVRIQHGAGESVLLFNRLPGSAVVAVSELKGRRCRATREGRESLLGYLGVSLAIDRSAAPGTGYAHVEVAAGPEGLTRTAYARSDAPAGKASVSASGVALDSLRHDVTAGRPRLVEWLDDGPGRQLLPAAEGTGSLVELRARFKDFDPSRPGARRFETDLEALYRPGAGAGRAGEDLASYLNAVLTGAPFGSGGAGSGLERRRRYTDVFGDKSCFEARVRASFEGQEIDVRSCDGALPAAAGVVVCLREERQACQFQDEREVVDVSISYGPQARGRLQLSALVTDPFGVSAPPAERLIPIPPADAGLDGNGLLRADVDEVIQGAKLSGELANRLDSALKETAAQPQQAGWPGLAAALPYVPACDERPRRARLFWLMAKTYSRDLELKPDEREALARLLASYQASGDECAR